MGELISPKKVAIYIRVSTLDQAQEGYSLAAQERTLRKWCADHGYVVYDVYVDAGISGKDITHRPSMQRLLDDARRHCFDIVLVWALSRFTRSVRDLYDSLAVLQQSNVSFSSHTEAFDTGTPMGRAMVGICGVFAQLEREITSERVRAAAAERAAQGKRTCSYVLGYDAIPQGGLQINPQEAIIVRGIFADFAAHGSLTRAAQLCQTQDWTGKRGSALKPQHVQVILTRFLYCGFYSFHRQPLPGDFDPLITKDEYNYIQHIIQDHDRIVGRHRKHPLIFL